MKNILKCLLFILSTFQLPVFANTTLSQDGWQDLHGQQVQENLRDNYASSVTECSAASPAFNCSGVLLRGTKHSTSYFAWNPSPNSVTSGGVSFSYLRTDSKYNNLAYNYTNGFFIYPADANPEDKITLNVLCSFPIDASSDSRSDAGCGAYTNKPESKQCQLQNITTAEEWYNHYTKYNNSHTSQCGFGLTSDFSNVTDAFYQTIKSMSLISNESFNDQNELRLATWAQNIPKQLPIEAFFYDSESGKASAQADQQDFYAQTNGMFVPVIKFTLPTSTNPEATFEYLPGDQTKTDVLSVSDVKARPAVIYTTGKQNSAQLSATVLSSSGMPIKGAMVTWVKTSTTAALTHTVTFTDAKGIAKTTLTDNVAENVIILAYGPDGKRYKYIIVPVKEGNSDYYIKTMKIDKTAIKANGADAATISVMLGSASGASLSGVKVKWSTTAGVLSAATTSTDSQGMANVSLTGTAPGQAIVTATLDNGNTQSTWIDIVQ